MADMSHQTKMSMIVRMLIVLMLAGAVDTAEAQLWSNYLAPARATDWTYAGVTGGIPSRTNYCYGPGGSVTNNPVALSNSNTPATNTNLINTAIQNCSAFGGGIVLLAAGTFNVASGMGFTVGSGHANAASNVTLKGSGANQTTLNFTGTGGSAWCDQGGLLCVTGSVRIESTPCNYAQSPNIATWNAPYTAGATTIQLQTIAGNSATDSHQLAQNMYVVLDELDNPTSDVSLSVPVHFDFWPNGRTDIPCNNMRTGRCYGEWHKVQSVTGTGPFTITLAEPIAYQYWNRNGNNQPQAYWCETPAQMPTMDGVEDLSVVMNFTQSGTRGGLVQFHGAVQSWMKNVVVSYGVNASPGGQMAAVSIDQSTHIEVRDSYIYGVFNPYGCGVAATQYGVEPLTASYIKVENNIFQQVCSPWLAQQCTICVIAYNYAPGNLPQWLNQCATDCSGTPSGLPMAFPSNFGHSGGTALVLAEGNEGIGISADHGVAHGMSPSLYTFYRNRFTGYQSVNPLGGAVPQPRIPADHQAHERFGNWIGNILGDPVMVGLGWGYQSRAGIDATDPHDNSDRGFIYSIGWPHGNGDNDPVAVSTFYRWCNYDHVTATTRQLAAEVPSGQFTPSVVTNCTSLPPSFYLNAKPSWFGSLAYPAIGPDVTADGSTGTALHVNNIPAKRCFLFVMGGNVNGTGAILPFDPATCYANGTGTDTTPPSAPTNLLITGTTINTIALSWTAATDNVGVTSYQVYRCNGSGCTPGTLVSPVGMNATVFTDSGLAQGATFTYGAKASDAAANQGAMSNTVTGTTNDTTPPAVPTGVMVQ